MSRTRNLNLHKIDSSGDVVLYWMSRDQRVRDNWALSIAQKEAIALKKPLRVVFTLAPTFLGATLRQYDFMLRGLIEVEKSLRELHIDFVVLIGDPKVTMFEYVSSIKVCVLYTDFSPLKISRSWRDAVAQKISCACIEVDAHNCVPVWVASDKKEFAAYTIRPKIYRNIEEYAKLPPIISSHEYGKLSNPVDWVRVRESIQVNTDVVPVTWCAPGETEALRALQNFLDSRLVHYGIQRNDPVLDGQSGLSPYLHFGHISSMRIAYEVSKKLDLPLISLLHTNKNSARMGEEQDMESNAEAFLEELIIRKELAENFCFYEESYDSVSGFPEWSQKNMKKTDTDVRNITYTLSQFEKANTHDEIWNAAQKEMVVRGKMHGYMRMYWAKKILEWTPSSEEALRIAIYLNDTYELDGRDPNGYAGIAWSIGGVHDRAWFSRPIFGQIRYMNYNGLKKKFDTKKYIEKIERLSGERLI